MLICRKRAARRSWLRAMRAGVPEALVTLLHVHYCEAHNAAEAARRLLYECADTPPGPSSN